MWEKFFLLNGVLDVWEKEATRGCGNEGFFHLSRALWETNMLLIGFGYDFLFDGIY